MVKYNGYANMKSSSLYPASGDSDDYMYKVDTVVKPKIFAMTPEVSNTSGGFWPASNEITGICQDMVFPNMILSHLTHRYLVVEDTDPSNISTMTGNFNHTAERLGLENGPVTVTITPISGIQSIGSGFVHNLTIMQTNPGNIAYVLNPGIQYGDEIKYVLNTEYIGWTKHDTITKTFGSSTSQFVDNAVSGANWTGTWATTTAAFVSPSSSFTDSPSGDYSNSVTRTYVFNNTVDLRHVLNAGVKFYAKWDIETDYDYVQFQVSTDNGVTWIGQCGKYTVPGTSANGSVQPNNQPVYEGTQNTWVLEEISLSDYIGDTLKIRFILKSDGGTRGDGFYFDDFELLYDIDYTGIDETTLNNFNLIPNPASNEVNINLMKPNTNTEVCVYTLEGQLVNTLFVNELTNQIKLSTSNLSNGIYMIQVNTNGKVSKAPQKLVIVH
jgi:hypothetical protein